MKSEYDEKHQYVVYRLNGITYVPHYRDVNYYVGPGFPRQNSDIFTPDELLAVGAVPHGAFLWKRAEHNTRGLEGLK